jgi:predicted lipoprotein with Yx(FWY)xxD motif
MNHSKRIKFRAMAAVVPLAVLAITACGSGTQKAGSVSRPTAASGQSATVGVANIGQLGEIVVDSMGRTLYLFQKDAGTSSACTGACAVQWPPLAAASTPVAGTGLEAAQVATIRRQDGTSQVTYNGHPLYSFAFDQKPGDANGQGITAFGGAWFVLTAAGNLVGTGSAPGGGYGY